MEIDVWIYGVNVKTRVTQQTQALYHTGFLAVKYTVFSDFHLSVINQQARGCVTWTTIEAQSGPLHSPQVSSIALVSAPNISICLTVLLDALKKQASSVQKGH